MHDYAFDFELETMFTMFISAIDEIIVKRFNQDRSEQEHIKVRFVYAPKQRVLADLLDKAQNIQLPVVSVTNGGVTRDPNRVFNKIKGSYLTSNDPRYSKKIGQPIPVDVTVNVSILTRYQKDFDQIITNICSYFDPYIVISWRTPSMPNEEIRSNVVWNGQISTTYPNDITSAQVAKVQGDTSFTIKGWLFKAHPDPDGNIFTITADFNQLSALTTQYSLDQLDLNLTDRIVVKAVPKPHKVNINYDWTQMLYVTDIISSNDLLNITNVYLTGSAYSSQSITFNPFVTSTTLSSQYPAFSAVVLPISSYHYKGSNMVINSSLVANIPGTTFVVENAAGYGAIIY
jgi:hypothetical protein